LVSASLTLTMLLVGLFILYYPQVVRREETALQARFGDDYRRYLARVPRWIPDFSLWRSPAAIEVRLRFVWRTLWDSAVFFLAFPVFELLDYLHEGGLLPVLLYLP
jgi:hypothetical protein